HLKLNNKMVFINSGDHIQVEKTIGIKSFTFGVKNSGSNAEVELVEANPFLNMTFNDIEIKTKIIGRYNYSNLAAAIAIGSYFEVSPEAIKTGIENYSPGNNRSQIIKIGSNTVIM